MTRKTNLGETRTPRRRRTADPMRTYDALPPPLRGWLAQAALPWSPTSCRRIWQRERARGESVEAILAKLDHAQETTLARENGLRSQCGHGATTHNQDG